MKNSLLLIICVMSLLVTACSDKTESIPSENDTREIHIKTEEPIESAAENPFAVSIRGVCGEEIPVTDLIAENPNLGGIDFSIYTYEGFGYYSPSDGAVVYKFDCDPFGEIDQPEMCPVDYRHIDAGDKILGLKLESASGMLFENDGVISLEQQELCFSGSIELNGFVYICRGDELYCDENQILFLPADGEWSGLPYHYMQGDIRYLGENYDFYWNGNAYALDLGNVSDYDFPELSEGGHSVREAAVVISDIIIRDCFTDMFFGAENYVRTAVLESIEFK